MPVACGGTTRKLGLLPLLLLLARSARVRSSPRTYSPAAAAAPAGGAEAGGGPGGRRGAGGGAAGGATAAPGAAARAPPAAAAAPRLPPHPPRETQGGRGRGTRGRAPRSLLQPSSAPAPGHPDARSGRKVRFGAAASLTTALGALPRAAPREPLRGVMGMNTEALTRFSPSGLWGRCGKSGARRGKLSIHVLHLWTQAGTEQAGPLN